MPTSLTAQTVCKPTLHSLHISKQHNFNLVQLQQLNNAHLQISELELGVLWPSPS